MTVPLPAQGDTSWMDWATQVHDATTTGLAGKAATSHTHAVADMTATGTRSSSTFLRGDNTWAVPAGGGGGTSSFETPMTYGAAGNGTTDDTTAVQSAMSSGRPVLIDRTYLVGGLTAASGLAMYGAPGGVLKRKSTSTYTISINSGSGGSSDPANNITGVQFVGLSFDDDVATNGFREGDAQLNLNACSDVLVSGCTFKAFRSDAIYLGSSNTGATERHNQRIKIVNNWFDGVNKNNRNGVSIIDGDDVLISGNTFRRMTRTDMPGAIDIEANPANTFAVLRDFRIVNNRFDDIRGFSAIGTLLDPVISYTTAPGNWRIEGNTFTNIDLATNPIGLSFAAAATDAVSTTLSAGTSAGATTFTTPVAIPLGTYVTIGTGGTADKRVVTAVAGTTAPFTSTVAAMTNAHTLGQTVVAAATPDLQIAVRNNTFTSVLRMAAINGCRGVTFAGNKVAGSTSAIMIGSNEGCMDLTFDRNEFYRCASADVVGSPAAINVVRCVGLKVDGNTFNDCGYPAGDPSGPWGLCLMLAGPGASDYIDFVGTNTMRAGTRMTDVTYKSSSHTKGTHNTYTAPIGVVGTTALP